MVSLHTEVGPNVLGAFLLSTSTFPWLQDSPIARMHPHGTLKVGPIARVCQLQSHKDRLWLSARHQLTSTGKHEGEHWSIRSQGKACPPV